MTYRVVVRRLAENDFAEAQDWYDEQRPGLGSEFRTTVDDLLARLAESPLIYPAIHGPIRRAVMRRFPFLIYFAIDGDMVVVPCVSSQQPRPSLPPPPRSIAGRLSPNPSLQRTPQWCVQLWLVLTLWALSRPAVVTAFDRSKVVA